MPSPNATQVTDMTVPVASVPDALHAGFRQEFVTADDEKTGVQATLYSGAGLGSPYLTLMVDRPGKPVVVETVKVTDFLPDWITAALARADAEAGS